jgi:hypothetical protein
MYDSSTSEIATTFLDKKVYTETTTLNTATYGNDCYILFSSKTYSASSTKNVENPVTLHPTWAVSIYIERTGSYVGISYNV